MDGDRIGYSKPSNPPHGVCKFSANFQHVFANAQATHQERRHLLALPPSAAGHRGVTPTDHDGGEDEGEKTRPDRGQSRGGNAPPFPEGEAPEVASGDDEGDVLPASSREFSGHFQVSDARRDRSSERL